MNIVARLHWAVRRRWTPACVRSGLDARLNCPNPGQALVMLALMMTALIGFAALATDTGIVWISHRSLQNAADAAALAGVPALPDNTALAISTGCDYATKNLITGMNGKTGTCTSKA